MGKKVAIIGAGVSGLGACKHVLAKGFHPVVFESRSALGGVWSKALKITKLQSPKHYYEFSDFPWPDSVKTDYPTQQQVMDYVQFDVPNFPEFPPNKGPSSFFGKVMHSKDYSEMDHETAAKFVKGKRVIVVGFHKSALDIAMECSLVNGTQHPCTLIYKNEHWHATDHSVYGFSQKINRFSELFFDKPGEGYIASLVATISYPVLWAIAKIIESNLKRKVPMAKYGMVPKHSYIDELNTCTNANGILPDNFYDRVEEGSIQLKKSLSLSFCEEGLILDSGDLVKADLVIFATGFRGEIKLKEIFESKRFQDLMVGNSKDSVPLYRGCIHPQIPQLAVIGFLSSVGVLFTSEMQSQWVSELLDGKFKPPSIRDMIEEMAKWDEFMIKKHAGAFYRRSCYMLLHIFYNDVLCKDMGWNPKRKKGFIAEWFKNYGPSDYASP
ncbi:hypothetical protein ACFE04_013054 [Oxalis oulophora]